MWDLHSVHIYVSTNATRRQCARMKNLFLSHVNIGKIWGENTNTRCSVFLFNVLSLLSFSLLCIAWTTPVHRNRTLVTSTRSQPVASRTRIHRHTERGRRLKRKRNERTLDYIMFVVCFGIILLLALFVQASSCLDVIFLAINTNIAVDLVAA